MSKENTEKTETTNSNESIVELAAKTEETTETVIETVSKTNTVPDGALLTCFCKCGYHIKNVKSENGIVVCPECKANNKC